jgi:hypothetical protein
VVVNFGIELEVENDFDFGIVSVAVVISGVVAGNMFEESESEVVVEHIVGIFVRNIELEHLRFELDVMAD